MTQKQVEYHKYKDVKNLIYPIILDEEDFDKLSDFLEDDLEKETIYLFVDELIQVNDSKKLHYIIKNMKGKITVYAYTQNPKALTRKDIKDFDNCVVMCIDEKSKGVFKNILKEDTSQIKLHSV